MKSHKVELTEPSGRETGQLFFPLVIHAANSFPIPPLEELYNHLDWCESWHFEGEKLNRNYTDILDKCK